MQIGVGTRDYIEVPWGFQVSPELEPDDLGPYFNVAVRGFGFDRDASIVIEAFVDEQRYAIDSHDDVAWKCRQNATEGAGLRLHLDPASLPPMPPPQAQPEEPPIDTGWDEEPVWDTGWSDSGWYVDTGWRGPNEGDVRVVATVFDSGGFIAAQGETRWFVYR